MTEQPWSATPPAPPAPPAAGPSNPTAPTSVAPASPGGARAALLAVRGEVGKAVVGQDAAVTGILIALLSRGHVLLEGVPGVAKTLLVRAVAQALSVETTRVQFTPDLMPGDITGSLIYDNATSEFSFREGPVFTNLLLADEINRTPPKTQASLLEAMEERQVSVDGHPRKLPVPFLVAATQNPVEYEGTYPLPEAQLDRFLLKVVLPVPPREQEIEIVTRHAAGFDPRDLVAAGIRAVASAADLAAGAADPDDGHRPRRSSGHVRRARLGRRVVHLRRHRGLRHPLAVADLGPDRHRHPRGGGVPHLRLHPRPVCRPPR